MEFLVPFGIVVLLHTFWNTISGSLVPDFTYGGYVVLGVIAWAIVFFFVHLGIKQIADEKAGKTIFKARST